MVIGLYTVIITLLSPYPGLLIIPYEMNACNLYINYVICNWCFQFKRTVLQFCKTPLFAVGRPW